MPVPLPNRKRMLKTATRGKGKALKVDGINSLGPEQAIKALKPTGDIQPFKQLMQALDLPSILTVHNTRAFRNPQDLIIAGYRYFLRCGDHDIPPTWSGLAVYLHISTSTLNGYLNGEDDDYSAAATRLRDVITAWAEANLYGVNARGATAHLGYLSSFLKQRLDPDKDKRFEIIFPESDRWTEDDDIKVEDDDIKVEDDDIKVEGSSDALD